MASIPQRIREFNSERLTDYVTIKYQMMAENAFRFLRGTCHLFYEDLQGSDAILPHPLTWICGDLHLENFGTYKGDNRLVYFDVNDFDEGLLAPALWEVSRMVTSIYTGLDSLGIPKKEAARVAAMFLRLYSDTLELGKSRYIEPRTANGIVQTFLDKVCERRQKDLIRQRTQDKGGRVTLRIDHIRFFPLDKVLRKELMAHLQDWLQTDPLLRRRYEVVDCAFRVAGAGSIGVRRYVFLAKNIKNPSKYLLIDMKQALPSCICPHANFPRQAWTSEAERIVAIQHRMQNISPALLRTTHFKGGDYVVKEMQPTADKIDFMLLRDRYKDIECVIGDMALLTASAQLRSAGRQGAAIPDELIAFGSDRHWQDKVLDYAAGYAGQVKKDYREFFIAYKDGYFARP